MKHQITPEVSAWIYSTTTCTIVSKITFWQLLNIEVSVGGTYYMQYCPLKIPLGVYYWVNGGWKTHKRQNQSCIYQVVNTVSAPAAKLFKLQLCYTRYAKLLRITQILTGTAICTITI